MAARFARAHRTTNARARPKALLQSIEISAILEVHGIPCGSLPRNGTKQAACAVYRENSLQSERLHFRQGEKPLFSGGWPSIGGPEPSVYIEPQDGKLWKGGALVASGDRLAPTEAAAETHL